MSPGEGAGFLGEIGLADRAVRRGGVLQCHQQRVHRSAQRISLEPADAAAKVIVNSRTGTVVIGSHVSVMPAAVTHGSLTVTITEDVTVTQPDAFSLGQTTITPKTDITVEEENNRMFKLERGVTLNDIVRAVNQVGAAPGDLVAILEALKQAGALRAQLVVI